MIIAGSLMVGHQLEYYVIGPGLSTPIIRHAAINPQSTLIEIKLLFTAYIRRYIQYNF